MWREGVGKNKDRESVSKLVRAEVPLRRHGRGNRLASAIGNTKTNEDASSGSVLEVRHGRSNRLASTIGNTKTSEDASSDSVLEVPFRGREIVSYDDIL